MNSDRTARLTVRAALRQELGVATVSFLLVAAFHWLLGVGLHWPVLGLAWVLTVAACVAAAIVTDRRSRR